MDKEKDTPVILVVDDEADLNNLMRNTLEREGYRTEGSLSVMEAFDRITRDPDLILLLDYRINDLTARDLINLIMKENLDVPFIVVTGQGDEEIAVEMMKLGARDYVMKGAGLIKVLPHVARKVINDLEFEKKHKQASQALIESESKFRSLFDQASDSILVMALPENGKIKEGPIIEDANEATLQMYGYSMEDLIGKPIAFLDLPESRGHIPERLNKLVQYGKASFEAVHVRKDGSKLDIEASVRVVEINGKQQLIAIHRDVSARKKNEEKLLKAREELQRTFESISDMVSLHSRDYKIVSVNKAVTDFFRKKPDELIGRYCYEVFHNSTEPPLNCPHASAIALKKPFTRTLDDFSKGVSVEISISPIFDHEGNVIETVHIAKDISARKRSDMALKDSERRYRELITSMPEAMAICQNGEIVYINTAGVALFGAASKNNIIGSSDNSLVHPGFRDIMQTHISESLKDGTPFSLSEVKMLRLNGSEFYADVAGAPANFLGRASIQLVMRDVSSRKIAEDELEKSQTALSALYQVSSAMSRTIDLKELMFIILETLTEIDIFETLNKGVIFIVDGDKMKLVSHLGHFNEFVALHDDMRVGDCLCGRAAETGKIIISSNSHNDDRHTISYPDMSPHGHIVVPLKIKGKVIGVLSLYLPAGFEMEESKLKLLETIGNQIAMAIENSRLYEETKRFSLHDPLTGLANRRYMEVVLERNLASAKRFKKSFSIVMADIDNFKKYNDEYGHVAGDEMLVNIARILERETRESDIICRYGGEEFIMLLSETGLSMASTVAEYKRKAVEEAAGITISLGVASYSDDIKMPEDLIKKADEALYKAKQNGRNRVEVYE